MSKKRRGKSRHRPPQTSRNTPEALAPQDTPVDIVFEPIPPEVSWIDTERPLTKEADTDTDMSEGEQAEVMQSIADAESLLAIDDDQVMETEDTDVGAGPAQIAEEPNDVGADTSIPEIATDEYGTPPDPVEVEEAPPEPADTQPMQTVDAPQDDAHEMPQAAQEPAVDNIAAEVRLDTPAQIAEEPKDPKTGAEDRKPAQDRKIGGGDVLDDQVALFEADADQMAESDQAHVPEDQVPVDPEPVEEEKPTDDQPEIDSDVKKKKPNPLSKIPIIGQVVGLVGDYVYKAKEYKRTFYEEKYWKKPKGMHGNMVRSKMLKRGWTYLHRVWWDNSLQSYRDDIIFVKQSDLTKQNPKHLSKWGERALPDPSTGEWLIFNSKIVPPEYEGENGFTASSAYLCMLDTSGEKAVKEATLDLKSGNHMDKFFIILIGGAFVIIFAYFLLGGFK